MNLKQVFMKKNILLKILFLVAWLVNPAQNYTGAAWLDLNKTQALYLSCGDKFFDPVTNNGAFLVPKVTNTTQGVGVSHASSFWIGGYDTLGSLHISAMTFRQNKYDYWPGPIDTVSGVGTAAGATSYDKVWKISYNEINQFITQYTLGNVPSSYTPSADFLSWPAHGSGNFTKKLAPFVDYNQNGQYDPIAGGDFPKIKGDQAVFSVFNDNYQTHTETGGLPLGIEVRRMAYVYGCPASLAGKPELQYTQFIEYEIINRSNLKYNNVLAGIWSDWDLGYFLDDYTGTFVPENAGFIYNGDTTDGPGTLTYGSYPPAYGITVLKGPPAPPNDGLDNDNDGQTDEPGEECLLNRMMTYYNNYGPFPPFITDPQTAMHYYYYLDARNKNGTKMTCPSSTITTDFMYPHTNLPSAPCGTWTEVSLNMLSGDHRGLVVSGPFTLLPKQTIKLEYALVVAVDSSATSNPHLASVNKLLQSIQNIRNYYYSGQLTSCVQQVPQSMNDWAWWSKINLTCNSLTGQLTIHMPDDFENKKINLEIYDVTGKILLHDAYVVRNNCIEAPVGNVSNGAYFVKISSDRFEKTLKFIKH
jgi:hypothetical protein